MVILKLAANGISRPWDTNPKRTEMRRLAASHFAIAGLVPYHPVREKWQMAARANLLLLIALLPVDPRTQAFLPSLKLCRPYPIDSGRIVKYADDLTRWQAVKETASLPRPV